MIPKQKKKVLFQKIRFLLGQKEKALNYLSIPSVAWVIPAKKVAVNASRTYSCGCVW